MTTRTVVVIPSRYEPGRLEALVRPLLDEAEVIVLDNGHTPPLTSDDPRLTIIDARGDGIYRMWNRGWDLAREPGGPVNVAVLNDDVVLVPGTISLLASALRRDPKIGAVYPDASVPSGPLPDKISYTTEWDPAGGRSLTGFCFMFKGELDLPPFDEGMEWWYGDSEFDESVKLAGYGVARIDRVPITHISDAESDDWARRPELKTATERDGLRWAERHDRIVDGHWVPRSRVVFLVPRRADNGPRDRLWAYCKARWQRYFPEIPIVEGHHDTGPFNRSAAINAAAAAAGGWEQAIVIDSDVLLSVSQVRAAIDRADETGRVTWAHRRWRGIREDAAERIVHDATDFGPEISRDELDLLVERTNPLSWSCCFVVPRAVWNDAGGFDERFVGWGFEDMAWQSLITGLYGHERIEGDVVHLWHPRSEERIVKGEGRITASPAYVTNARLGRRYMVAVRRDHGLTDRQTPTDDAEMIRDIANLHRDDEAYEAAAQRHHLPDWSTWWPTLEELRDGAKAHRGSPVRSVTVVLRSGGEPATWAERSGYLQASLASFADRVTGPIVQRVIYSDWGPTFRPDLDELAAAHGFYVVGPTQHVGYVGAMQALWRYLNTRAQGTHVFSVEDDFVYDRDVDLEPMIAALDEDPSIRQLALLRGPYYPREIEAGGVLESLPTPVELQNHRPYPYVTHRDHFTANPSLFRRELVRDGWPSGSNTERVFGDLLLRDPAARFAYWGSGEPWITHVGAVRAGTAY